jgi:hypothetical protein
MMGDHRSFLNSRTTARWRHKLSNRLKGKGYRRRVSGKKNKELRKKGLPVARRLTPVAI